jgi:hypothetical protein
MTGNEDFERRPSRRMPDAYRHFLAPRRPSQIFATEHGEPGPSVSDDADAAVGETDREPA